MKYKIIALLALIAAFQVKAQVNTNIVVSIPDTSPLLTNKVSVVLTSNQWNTIRVDYKLWKAMTQSTNSFGDYQDSLANRYFTNYVKTARASRLLILRTLMAREPSEDKVDAAISALR